MAKAKGSRKRTCKCGANQYGLPGTHRKCNDCQKHTVYFVKLKPVAKKAIKKAIKKAVKGKRR
jgi:hypothetical protein